LVTSTSWDSSANFITCWKRSETFLSKARKMNVDVQKLNQIYYVILTIIKISAHPLLTSWSSSVLAKASLYYFCQSVSAENCHNALTTDKFFHLRSVGTGYLIGCNNKKTSTKTKYNRLITLWLLTSSFTWGLWVLVIW
jgi:hypothetical protein